MKLLKLMVTAIVLISIVCLCNWFYKALQTDVVTITFKNNALNTPNDMEYSKTYYICGFKNERYKCDHSYLDDIEELSKDTSIISINYEKRLIKFH